MPRPHGHPGFAGGSSHSMLPAMKTRASIKRLT